MTRIKVKERNAAIRREFDALTSKNAGMSARKACARLANDNGLCCRHIWRILKAEP